MSKQVNWSTEVRSKLEKIEDAVRLIAPFIRDVNDEKITIAVYLCAPLECDYVSPKPGECPRHGRTLVQYVFVQER